MKFKPKDLTPCPFCGHTDQTFQYLDEDWKPLESMEGIAPGPELLEACNETYGGLETLEDIRKVISTGVVECGCGCRMMGTMVKTRRGWDFINRWNAREAFTFNMSFRDAVYAMAGGAVLANEAHPEFRYRITDNGFEVDSGCRHPIEYWVPSEIYTDEMRARWKVVGYSSIS